MRTSLIALLAFAAGVLAMLLVQGWLPPHRTAQALRIQPAAPGTTPLDDAEAPA